MSKLGINKERILQTGERKIIMMKLRQQKSEKIKKRTKKKRVAARHDEGKKGNNDARVFEM